MSDPDQRKLDELQADIDEARQNAVDHGTIPDEEPTLLDPDGDGDVDEFEAQPPG